MTARLWQIGGNQVTGAPQIASEMAAPPALRTPMGTAARAAIRVRMEAWRQWRWSQSTEDNPSDNGRGKVQGMSRGEGAPAGAHEALPHTPPGGKPPETLAPVPSESMFQNGGNLSRGRKPRTNRAPLTDSLRSEDLTGMRERGPLARGSIQPPRRSAPS